MSVEGERRKNNSPKEENNDSFSDEFRNDNRQYEWPEGITPQELDLQQAYEDIMFLQELAKQQNILKESNLEEQEISNAVLFGSARNREDTYEEEICERCENESRFFYESTDIVRRLYFKYASSQNYYYTRDINEILQGTRTSVVINFKDDMTADEQAEYLKRFYFKEEHSKKNKLLTEYYKFHKDIPRLFMLPETIALNNFHDKKRRFDYYRIAQIIEEENKLNPERPPKGIVGEKPPIQTNQSSVNRTDEESDEELNLLDKLGKVDKDKNLLSEISSFVNRGRYSTQSKNDETKNNENNNNNPDEKQPKQEVILASASPFLKYKVQASPQFEGYHNQKKNVRKIENPTSQADQQKQTNTKTDQSATIHELNMKLEEIVTSHSLISITSASQKLDEEVIQYGGRDLDDFLDFLNKKQDVQKIGDQESKKKQANLFVRIQIPNLQAPKSIENQLIHQGKSQSPINNQLKSQPNTPYEKQQNTQEYQKQQTSKDQNQNGFQSKVTTPNQKQDSVKVIQQKGISSSINKQTLTMTNQATFSNPTTFNELNFVNNEQVQYKSIESPKNPKKKAPFQLKLEVDEFYDTKNPKSDKNQEAQVLQGTGPALSTRSARDQASPSEGSSKNNAQLSYTGISSKVLKSSTLISKQQSNEKIKVQEPPIKDKKNPSLNFAFNKQTLNNKQQPQPQLKQPQLHHQSNSLGKPAPLNSVSSNSFAQNTKESQLFTPRQPPSTSNIVQSQKGNKGGFNGVGSKTQLSPRDSIPSPKNMANMYEKLNQQQQLQIFQQQQQQFQAGGANQLKNSSIQNSNNTTKNVGANSKKPQQSNTQRQALQTTQQKSQTKGSWKQMNFKLKLDLFDNSKEKQNLIAFNTFNNNNLNQINSSSTNTLTGNLYSSNSNTLNIKEPLSQRSCSSKNMDLQTPKHNFYEMFRQQIASSAYSQVLQSNNSPQQSNNSNQQQQLNAVAKGTAIHMLNLIKAQQAQSKALTQNKNISSSPSARHNNQNKQFAQFSNLSNLNVNNLGNLNNPQISVKNQTSKKNADSHQFFNQNNGNNNNQQQLPFQNYPTYGNQQYDTNLVNSLQQSGLFNQSALFQNSNLQNIQQKKLINNLIDVGEEGAPVNKYSVDQTSQRKVVGIIPSTTKSEAHTRKNSSVKQIIDKSQHQFATTTPTSNQMASNQTHAGIIEIHKQASHHSSFEKHVSNFLRKKSSQLFKYEQKDISKNNYNLTQQLSGPAILTNPQTQITVSSARTYKAEGHSQTIPLPNGNSKGQLQAYHQPRPLISQNLISQLNPGVFYDISVPEQFASNTNITGFGNSNMSVQQNNCSVSQKNMGISNSVPVGSNNCSTNFSQIPSSNQMNNYTNPHLHGSQQQQIGSKFQQNSSKFNSISQLKQPSLKQQQSSSGQPYSQQWQHQMQEQQNSIHSYQNNLLNSPYVSQNISNNGGHSVRGHPTSTNPSGKLNSPLGQTKMNSMHKHAKSENLLSLLSEVNLQNQPSNNQVHMKRHQKLASHIPLSSDQAKLKSHLQQGDIQSNGIQSSSQQPIIQNNSFYQGNFGSCSPSLQSNAAFQAQNLNFFNSNVNFVNHNLNYSNFNDINELTLNNQEELSQQVSTHIPMQVGSSSSISPRISNNSGHYNTINGAFPKEKNNGFSKKIQAAVTPVSSRNTQGLFQNIQLRSIDNSINNQTNSQNHVNPNVSSNNNSSCRPNSQQNIHHYNTNNINSHQTSSLHVNQPPYNSYSASQGISSQIAKKFLIEGQISSQFSLPNSQQKIQAKQPLDLQNKKNKKKQQF